MKIMQYVAFVSVLACLGSVSAAQTVFTADFEESSLDEMAAQWNEAKNLDGMAFSSEVPPESPGSQSLMMTAVIGENTGGHLYKMFPEGFDSLYARFYVKFSATHNPVHHFVHMGGYNPPTRWPQGGAGERPAGDERFTTGIESFGQKWQWDFYSYWMHMRGNPVPNKYWGNNFLPQPPAPVTRGTWQCVEFMMKCNDPVGAYNGEQAFWIDGKKVLHLRQGAPRGYWVWDTFRHHPDSAGFEGFQWRSDEDLRVNFFWLLYYMTAGPEGQKDTVWFDDVVVSTSYTGPHAATSVLPLPADAGVSLEAWPNPFAETVTLHTRGADEVAVYDMYGREVQRYGRQVLHSSGGTVTWTPTMLPPGAYIICGFGPKETFVRQVRYLPR